jgi:carbon storage regulator
MLVLSRKSNERILVGDSIRITVLETRGTEVRLGFEAPDGVRILREELLPRSMSPEGVDLKSRESGGA